MLKAFNLSEIDNVLSHIYLKRFFTWLLLAFAVLILFTYITSPLVVTVNGVGEIDIPADEASVTLTITDSNSNPSSALKNLAEKTKAVKQILLENGFQDATVIETQPQLLPAALVTAQGTGYQASMSLGGKTSQVDKVSGLTALLYEWGAAYVTAPVLSRTDYQEQEAKALEKALADAAKRAGQIAQKNRKFFKKVAVIDQITSPTTGSISSSAGSTETNAPPQLSTNALKITKLVSVTYRMW